MVKHKKKQHKGLDYKNIHDIIDKMNLLHTRIYVFRKTYDEKYDHNEELVKVAKSKGYYQK